VSPWVKRLLIANGLMFLMTVNNPNSFGFFGFRPVWIVAQPWSLFTYMFVHADTMHLLFNMLFLYFFGSRLEDRLGSKGFIKLYMYSGLGGAFLSFLTPTALIIGASGAVLGVMTAFVVLWPHEKILLFFVLPVPVRWLVAFQGLTAIWGSLGVIQNNTAHFAHLGGIAVGFLFMRFHMRNSAGEKFKKQAAGGPGGAGKVPNARVKQWMDISREGLHEINREELDRVLDKISALGAEALTVDERAFLERFST
jgi:membrane associated rhomboid family serine protease